MYFSLDHLVWGGHDFGYACLTKLKKLSENVSFQMHVGRDPLLNQKLQLKELQLKELQLTQNRQGASNV
jgi:hypothetical protein